jgi:hypothetical protein
MRFKVFVLRHRGRRLSWRDVHNGPSFIGHLVTHEMAVGEEKVRVATLRADDPAAPTPIPPLYEPVLFGVSPLALRLRGFERVERSSGTFAVLQEWHCELP